MRAEQPAHEPVNLKRVISQAANLSGIARNTVDEVASVGVIVVVNTRLSLLFAMRYRNELLT